MRKIILITLMLFVGFPVAAQNNCGYGLPCGPVPFTLPQFPDLRSPTPVTDAVISNNPGATPTSIPNPTIEVDTSGIEDSIATLQAVMDATSVPIANLEGTPVSPQENVTELIGVSETFFGYVKGLAGGVFGPITPLIMFSITALLIVISVTSIRYLFPVVMATLGILRKLISLLFDFLPF